MMQLADGDRDIVDRAAIATWAIREKPTKSVARNGNAELWSGFTRDNPDCEMHSIDASHFPLDEMPDEVCALRLALLERFLT
jgi:hypothetical protein